MRALKNKHQIIISTHSSNIIKNLPKDAVKLFHISENTNKVDIVSDISPEEAFFHLGDSLNKKTIFVEDCLAVEIVKKAIKEKGKAFYSQFDVKFIPGGADAIITRYIAPFSAAKTENIMFLLDGDKNKNVEFFTSSSIPVSQNDILGQKIKDIIGCDVKFLANGNNGQVNKQALYGMQRDFIDYIYQCVTYLPMKTPETFILENIPDDYKCLLDKINKNLPEKDVFRELCKLDFNTDECTSADIFNMQRRIVGKIESSSRDLHLVRNIITFFADYDRIQRSDSSVDSERKG